MKLKIVNLTVCTAIMCGMSHMAQAETKTIQPDNSAVNKIENNTSGFTAQDQSNKREYVELTRKIRDAITSNDQLSTYAQNIKIITDTNGIVTLKGPVRTEKERQELNSIARKLAGAHQVNDQLEIAAG